MIKSLGADYVLDYMAEDFTNNAETYDIIFDTVGKTSHTNTLRSLREGGAYLQAVAGPAELIRMMWASKRSGRIFIGGIVSPTSEDLMALNDLWRQANSNQ